MGEKREIELTVNGQAVTREIEVRWTLVDFLRHELKLTGTHVGCEHGVCGAWRVQTLHAKGNRRATSSDSGHTKRPCFV